MKLNFQDLVKLSFAKLSKRPHSTAEIRKYLSSKTSDSDLVDRVIDYLTEKKFLGDTEFTSWLVESRSRSRPRGLRLIKQELKQKGIEGHVEVDEIELAKKALEKKDKLWSTLNLKEYRLKATNFLRYRGFTWPAIEKVVKLRYNESHVSDF